MIIGSSTNTRIHLICRNGLHLSPTEFPEFESGYWDLPEKDAQQLIDGMLYLHETKAAPSYFGGTVKACRVAEGDFDGRIVFTVISRAEGKGAKWEGASHAMAWTGGIVEK